MKRKMLQVQYKKYILLPLNLQTLLTNTHLITSLSPSGTRTYIRILGKTPYRHVHLHGTGRTGRHLEHPAGACGRSMCRQTETPSGCTPTQHESWSVAPQMGRPFAIWSSAAPFLLFLVGSMISRAQGIAWCVDHHPVVGLRCRLTGMSSRAKITLFGNHGELCSTRGHMFPLLPYTTL
jgi:hypothetical protein